MPSLGQISFLIALVMLAGLLISTTWSVPRRRPLGILAALLLVGAWWLLRPGAGGAATTDAVNTALGSGRPVVVEVYSDY
ncbi:MAG TPA: hypothetical protein VM536_14025 [Chloroflexia bacterium]|nr:hypothetical protein [Chloroflexia bacterium]